MNVVSFYTPRPDPRHVFDFVECLRVQRRSCDRFACRHIVITDRPEAIGPGIEPFEAELPQPIMLASLAGQLAYLESPAFDADTLLTDCDTLLTADPRGVIDGSFDLAVTVHPFRDCILNNGAIFVPLAARDLVVPIWRTALEDCGTDWGEDQRALRDALGATLELGVRRIRGARVKFLPCTQYNWAPESDRDPCAALVVHFRGSRKRFMAEWARIFAQAAMLFGAAAGAGLVEALELL